MAEERDDEAELQRAFMEASGLGGTGGRAVTVAGITRYQAALVAITGREPAHLAQFDCEAHFVAEPTNPKDADAVAVYIDGHHVGYLPAGSEPPSRSPVPARISAGWRRDDNSPRSSARTRFYGVTVWL